MLRVGLTGELGSGKSTVARLLAARGAIVLSSDEMGRSMMQPGHAVFDAIVDRFGPTVLQPDGQLDRPELARLAFDPAHSRVEELNAIVHPAVIAEQERLLTELARTTPDAIVVIESALIFSTTHAGTDQPWRKRFDRIVVVTAPDELKIERFVQRAPGFAALDAAQQATRRQDAVARLRTQKASFPPSADPLLVPNTGDLHLLETLVDELFKQLQAASR